MTNLLAINQNLSILTKKLNQLSIDFIIKLKDGRIGLLDPHGVHFSDFKAKADGLRKYIQSENKKGKKLFGGILTNTDQRNYQGRWVYFNRPKEDLTNSFDNWATLEL